MSRTFQPGIMRDGNKMTHNFPKNIIDEGRPYVLEGTFIYEGNTYATYELNDPTLTIDDLRSEPDTFIELSLDEALEVEA